MIFFVSMQTDESSNIMDERSRKIEEEIRKRNLEIQKKLHPELYDIQIQPVEPPVTIPEEIKDSTKEDNSSNLSDSQMAEISLQPEDSDVIVKSDEPQLPVENAAPQQSDESKESDKPAPEFSGSGRSDDSIQSDKSDESDKSYQSDESLLLPHQGNFITDFDLYLFSNGTHYKVFDKFGAHITNEHGADGVRFTTWAPNAEKVCIVGEFNGWAENDNHVLQHFIGSGVWSGFIPGMTEGDTYKYSIKSNADGQWHRKSDPYAFRTELRPKNASIVGRIDKYTWRDDEWMRNRKLSKLDSKPLNIYECHLGSWKRDKDNKEFPNEWGYLNYSQLAHDIVAHVKEMGYTHIELLPVMEHPLDISWGYQVTSYYAPSSRFGTPDDFMYFVDYCHQNNIGVILDWVPAHFPSDEHALAFFDGKQIYAYEDAKKGVHKDWNTYIFDYGRNEVKNFLIGSALFWIEKYHADGLRVDAVASMLYLDYSRNAGEWVPNVHGGRENLEAIEFLKHLNDIMRTYHSDTLMIAEESTAWPGVSHPVQEGGLGFNMKWNMGWMNDILLYFSKDPVYRKFHQGKITFSLWYAFSENFILPVSHDEVVHGKRSLLEKMPGDYWQKFANMRLFLGFMFGHPGKKLNFMTNDVAQYNEWYSETSLEWNLLNVDLNGKLNKFVKDLNALYLEHPALFEIDFDSSGFKWIDFSDAVHSVLSFYRVSKKKDEILLFTLNMTPTVHYDYRVGVPEDGYWKEILNSDAEIYGGSDIGNMGGVKSEPLQFREFRHSIKVTLPPLAMNIYKLGEAESEPAEDSDDADDELEEFYRDTGGGD